MTHEFCNFRDALRHSCRPMRLARVGYLPWRHGEKDVGAPSRATLLGERCVRL